MNYHAESAKRVLEALDSAAAGLSQEEAARRLAEHGPNRLPEHKRRPPWMRFLLQFHNPLIYLLIAAAMVTLWLQHYVDSGVIAGVVIINAIIGFIQEGKAERALDAVSAMLASRAMVLRDGERREVAAADLVPGDLVLLEAGAQVPADLRLLSAKELRVTESALTGESVPVEKRIDPAPADAAVADRTSMTYSGTVVANGQGRGVVTATGQATEIGRIGALVSGVQTLSTPLTQRLDQFARQITVFVLVVGLLTFAYGHLVLGQPLIEVFLAVVGLAVAAIPEGLPAIVTITLAIGTGIMARQRAIVRRLPAVETLGSVSVIGSDKTGTLTKNEMTAVNLLLPARRVEVSGAGYAPEGAFHTEDGSRIDAEEDAELQRLARCALLCNDARVYKDEQQSWRLVGDPTEGALMTLALKAGLDSRAHSADAPRTDEIPFTSEHRLMVTLHHDHQGRGFALLKGAPEQVLALCRSDSAGEAVEADAWLALMEEAAAAGQRVLALAECDLPAETTSLNLDDLPADFTLLGLVGIIDPPRPEAIAAVAECREAGIRTVMITGDHAGTAAAIGAALGLRADAPLTGREVETLDDAALRRRLEATDIVARASPEHKLRLIQMLQADGQLVAMTGDGVNDAPALKAANIGVAMGDRGTDAAKEAADLVLTDDNFATIAGAVREGRRVFDNIKKALLFILPTNGGEAAVILVAVFAGLTLPVSAAQILWINMITAVTLALALAFEPAEGGVMQRPPRPASEPLITRLLLGRVLYVSALMFAVSFIVFEWEMARGSDIETARTAVVNMLVLGELVYLFNVRHFTAPAWGWGTLFDNRVAFWASVVLIGFQLLFTYAPPMQALFETRPLDGDSWLLILVLGLLKFAAVEAEKWGLRRFGVTRL